MKPKNETQKLAYLNQPFQSKTGGYNPQCSRVKTAGKNYHIQTRHPLKPKNILQLSKLQICTVKVDPALQKNATS